MAQIRPQALDNNSFPATQRVISRDAYKDLISGSISGIFGVLSGHPLDTVKVRMQMFNQSFWRSTVSIFRQEGILSFYTGVGSPLYTAPAWNSLYYAFYEMGNRAQGMKQRDKIPFSVAFLSGAWSGIALAAVITPIELIKCQQQILDAGKNREAASIGKVIRNIIKRDGFMGIFKGFGITCLRDIPGVGGQLPIFTLNNDLAEFAFYEWSKNQLNNYFRQGISSFLAGGIGAVIGWIVNHPQDVIKTRMQCSDSPIGILTCSKEIYLSQGFGGFWRGLMPCLGRSVFSGACRFLAYEQCKKLLYN